ncbi:MAG: SDR family oxidoreductase [Chloroflexi bacterium]|nr:SDR family oxidoreductase [Chloroflexota bacterium]
MSVKDKVVVISGGAVALAADSVDAEGLFQKVIDTNIVGTFLGVKHVLPYMESLNDGHIIVFGQGNVSEQRNPNPGPSIGSATYSVTKIAIRALARAVVDEERESNVCVMSTSPDATGAA